MRRPPGRPSVAESENIRQRILSAATQEFMTAGYEDCSMNRIAHAAGSTKQTIYRLYPSKELLFKTVVATVIQEGVAQSADFRDDPREPAAVLRDAAARIQEIAADQTLVRLWRAADAVRRKFPELYLDVMEMV